MPWPINFCHSNGSVFLVFHFSTFNGIFILLMIFWRKILQEFCFGQNVFICTTSIVTSSVHVCSHLSRSLACQEFRNFIYWHWLSRGIPSSPNHFPSLRFWFDLLPGSGGAWMKNSNSHWTSNHRTREKKTPSRFETKSAAEPPQSTATCQLSKRENFLGSPRVLIPILNAQLRRSLSSPEWVIKL